MKPKFLKGIYVLGLGLVIALGSLSLNAVARTSEEDGDDGGDDLLSVCQIYCSPNTNYDCIVDDGTKKTTCHYKWSY